MAIDYRDYWEDLRQTAERFVQVTGRTNWQALLLEPGITALGFYRVAHWLYANQLRMLAELVAERGRRATGIDIHPGARIGRRCMLMRGAPIVIGETAVVGDDCTLEPGAMLLGSGLPGARMHPTLGNTVVVEAGAMLIGEVFIGNDVRIHAGAVVSRDVPDGGVAVGVPGRILPRAQARPDPDARAIQAMAERLYHLEEQLQILAFATQRQGSLGDRWTTHNPKEYGPIAAVEELVDGAGI